MAKLPFMTRLKMNPSQAPSGAVVSSHPQAISIDHSKLPPPPSLQKNDLSKNERGKKRQSEGEVTGDALNKKKKAVVAVGSSVDTIASVFGGLTSRHYTELDVNTRMGRNDEEEEVALKAGMGDIFFHGLRVLSQKNLIIKDQEKQNKRLATEIGNLNMKVAEVEKKAAEEARLLKEDAEKAWTELAKVKADHDRIVCVIEGELTSTQVELESLKVSSQQKSMDQYDKGYLDYLRTFLAADPEYSWSKFLPSILAFMETFKVDNVAAIKEAKEALAVQFKEETEKAAAESIDNAADASPFHQAAS